MQAQSKMKFTILTYVLEDNEVLLTVIKGLLDRAGITEYQLFSNPAQFIKEFTDDVHVCVIDYHLPGETNGLEVLQRVLARNPRCKAIIISAQEKLDIVIDILNAGAYKYIRKNDDQFNEKLVRYLQQAIERINHDLIFYHALKEKLFARENSNGDNSR